MEAVKPERNDPPDQCESTIWFREATRSEYEHGRIAVAKNGQTKTE
jgi:hypothetical protein